MGDLVEWIPEAQPYDTKGKNVEYKMRNGEIDRCLADHLDWLHRGDSYDIVAYRVID